MIHSIYIIFYFALLFLVACNSAEIKKTKELKKPISSTQTRNENILEEDQLIVARVNETVITKDQLDYAITRLLPKNLDKNTKEKLSGKVLNSLVDSRLMATIEEAKLDKQKRQLINNKTEAYREELLVKKYITENVKPQPITQEDIYKYYQGHLDEFGESLEKTYEIIQSKKGLEGNERTVLLTKLSSLSTVDNWLDWYENNKDLDLSYRNSTSSVRMLEKPLRALVEATADGKTSPLLNGKILIVVRVRKSKKIPAKPFEQVSGKIRRMMAPQALKKSLRDHLIRIKKNASIHYLLESENGNAIPANKSTIAGVRK